MRANEEVTLALDAMGGDHGPCVTVPAALRALKQYPQLKIILVGDDAILSDLLKYYPATLAARCRIQAASEVVDMDEAPSQALRYKKDSSMRVAINLLKSSQAQACVSAGNTGALMAIARFVLKTLPGIDRPAIISTLPTHSDRKVRMLDLGANVDSSAQHLYQFAVMGSIVAAVIDHIDRPRVGLLNVGSEDIKGNEQVKKTAELLSNSVDVNFTGYIEGNEIFHNKVDVVVCDGFIGNIALKTLEGFVKFIRQLAKATATETIWTRCLAILAKPIFRRLAKRIDTDSHNGAVLLGLNGVVVKSHGGANAKAFFHAIEEAIEEAKNNIPNLIKHKVAEVMANSASANGDNP